MANNKKGGSALGVAAAIAAAVAGAYYLYGKDGAKHRKQVKGWALKAKGEVLERMGDLEEITQTAYEKLIDDVGKQYKAIKTIDKAELAEVIMGMKKEWNRIRKAVKDIDSKQSSVAKKKTTKPAPKKKSTESK